MLNSQNDGFDHLWQPLLLACVLIHFDRFWRFLVGMGLWSWMKPLPSLTNGAGQPDMCTRVLSTWVWGGEMPGLRRYQKEGIKHFTTSTLQYPVKEMAGIYGEKV